MPEKPGKAQSPRNLGDYPGVWCLFSSFYGAYVRPDFFLGFGTDWQLVESNIRKGQVNRRMEIRYVDDSEGLEAVRSILGAANRIALDCEAAGYHRYTDRLCLVQLTTEGQTYLLDPLKIDLEPALRPVLEDPAVEVMMHGADFDVRLLDRDLGISVTGLFDTQIAASLLGVEALGLSSLVDNRLGIHLSKKYQKADWAQRPLPAPMREYAAHDTTYLAALSECLREELVESDRLEWALEEFHEMEKVRFDEPNGQEPVLRIKQARELEPREVDRLREALAWRDRLGRELDRALFRVAGDSVLVEAARRNPASVSQLAELKGMGRALAHQWGQDLLIRFRDVDLRSKDQLVGYPMGHVSPNGSGRRPSPEVEARMARLKAVRNECAEALGVGRGTLLSNAVLKLIAESPPTCAEEVASVGGIRRWQAELLADDLIASL